MTTREFPVLSIDAWADGEGSWNWNAWYKAGTVEIDENATDAELIEAMVSAGYVNERARDECVIDDDQYNWVLVAKDTREPLYAVEYGSAHGGASKL